MIHVVERDELEMFAPFAGDDVYLYFDPQGRELWVENHLRRYPINTFDLVNSVEFRFPLQDNLSGPTYARILHREEVQALAERIAAGHDIEWGGNGLKGVLSEDAEAALAELDKYISERWGGSDNPDGDFAVWDAESWFQDEEPVVHADATDEELDELEAALQEDAAGHRAYVLDLYKYLGSLRRQAQYEALEDDE